MKTLMYQSVLVGILVAAPLDVSATEGQSSSTWKVRAEVLTGFPLQIGGGAYIEGPHRFRLHSSLGILPQEYLDSVNALAEAAEWYGPTTSELISAALENSIVWRTHAGWRPFASSGFYFGGGYTLTALGGGLTGAELLIALTGQTLPRAADSQQSLNVNAMTHMLDIETGWEWFLSDNLVIRASVGGSFTVASQTEVSTTREIPPRFTEAVEDLVLAGEQYLDDTLQSYIHTAVLLVSVGWQF